MPVEKRNRKIIWFRSNLRTHDAGFWNHIQESDEVVAVYCLEPEWLKPTPYGWKKMEVYRAQFLLESLADLKQNLSKYGISFYFFQETASKVFQQISDFFHLKQL